jgi:undecaprenyl-diphosphatase
MLGSRHLSKAENAMDRTSIGEVPQKLYRTQVDRFFLRMNRREISIVSSVMRHSQPRALSAVLNATNRLCDGWIYLPIVLWLMLMGEWRLMVVAALGAAVSFLLYFSAKPWIARMRPCHFAEHLSTGMRCLDQYSFPSGHCMTLSVVGVLLCWQHHSAIPVLMAMVLLLSWARVAVAHHYPTDLIAGIAVGLCVGVPLASMFL